MTLGWAGSGGMGRTYLPLVERACLRIVVNRGGNRREAGAGDAGQGVQDDLARAPAGPGQGRGAARRGRADRTPWRGPQRPRARAAARLPLARVVRPPVGSAGPGPT